MVSRIPVGRVCARRFPRSTIACVGRPQISATRSGGYSRMRRPERLPADACARPMKSLSSAPSASTTCMRPSASAASVPGIGARCVSAASPVRVRTRVDDDEMRALLAGRGDAAPEVMVRGQRVAAPQDDEPREAQRLRVHPHAVVAERVAGADPAGDRADRHQVVGRPERVPQPAPRAVHALDEPHAAGADVGPDGLGAELADRAGQPLGDLVERLLPGDALEARRAPWDRGAASDGAGDPATGSRRRSRSPCCTGRRG